jgi:site-specific DNA-methyltransferase (adenine-specific)
MHRTGDRRVGRMSVSIEDAGFVTHPFIAWIFAQGFPKAHRVHDEQWEGFYYGTQSLKPSIEPIYVGQKPFENGLNGTQNILKWRTGALNIDACRVATNDRLGGGDRNPDTACNFNNEGWRRPWMSDPAVRDAYAARIRASTQKSETLGRWPSNVIHDDSDEVVAAFPDAPGQQRAVGPEHGEKASVNVYGDYGERPHHEPRNDSGSAARFFFTAKATADDRIGSNHPTVKPVSLMRYLVRLVTPPDGLILDPFAGTGTTAEAAYHEGFRSTLIEAEPEYQKDIRRRLDLVRAGKLTRKVESLKASNKVESQDTLPLFRSHAA